MAIMVQFRLVCCHDVPAIALSWLVDLTVYMKTPVIKLSILQLWTTSKIKSLDVVNLFTGMLAFPHHSSEAVEDGSIALKANCFGISNIVARFIGFRRPLGTPWAPRYRFPVRAKDYCRVGGYDPEQGLSPIAFDTIERLPPRCVRTSGDL